MTTMPGEQWPLSERVVAGRVLTETVYVEFEMSIGRPISAIE
jgi:hypothetical protein